MSFTPERPVKLILLPGLDGTGIQFRPLLDVLPKHIEPVVVTYPLDLILDYEALFAYVRKRLPNDEGYVLLGESFGGPLSIKLAAERPRGLMGLVLCATFVQCPQGWAPPWSASLVWAWQFILFPKLAQAKVVLGGYATSELLALAKEALEMVQPDVLAHRVREVIKVDVVTELQTIDVPVQYLRGRDDHVVPTSNMRQIQALCRNLKVAELPAPHMVLQTQPQLASQAIERFIAELV